MDRRRPGRWYAGMLLAMAAVLAGVRPLPAFTYEEHCRVSNAALAIAVRYADRAPALDSAFDAVTRERLRLLSIGRCDPQRPESYGDLVALADYALNPVEYYAYVPNRRTPLLLAGDDLPWLSIEAMGSWRLQNLRSAHINEDHFEDRALISQFIWHEAATHMAASRRRLMGGLLVNAFADHFLQDFFAPGHIHTPRRRLHDVTALGRHDAFNRYGERFYPVHADELAPLLLLADSVTAAPCSGKRAAVCLCALGDTGFVAGGDGTLEERPTQRMYLTLVTARSIVDVLASYAAGTSSSSFGEAKWWELELVERVYGRVDPRTLKTIQVLERYAVLPHAGTRYGEFRSRSAGEVSEMALGITVGHQSVLSRNRRPAARALVGLEMLLYTTAGTWPGDLPRQRGRSTFRQSGVGLSYNVHLGEGEPSHGAGLRLILPMTEINSQVSLGATGRFNPALIHNIAWGVEARAEMGFGMAFLGIGVGHEWQASIPSSQARWVVTSSVSAAAPFSSLLHRLPPRRAGQ